MSTEYGIYRNIEIVAKVVYNGDVLWYLDKNNARYYKDDIINIIDNGYEPPNCDILRGYIMDDNRANYRAKINMCKHGNTIRCKDGRLKELKLINKDPICIINEDTNSGYALTYNLLTRRFPNVQFIFYQAKGNGDLPRLIKKMAIDKLYKNYIIIYDDKVSASTTLLNIVKARNLLSQHANCKIFNPISIEYCIESWLDLQLKNNSIYHRKLAINQFKTGKTQYMYVGHDTFTDINGNKITNIEDDIAQELIRTSVFIYTKGHIHECIYLNCCPFKVKTLNKEVSKGCNYIRNLDKIQSLFNRSLFKELGDIVNNYLIK